MSDSLKGAETLAGKLKSMVDRIGKNPNVEVGFMENSTCGIDNDASAPSVAFFNEFGTISKLGNVHIPARPFFRTAIAKNSPTWGKLVAAALKMANMDAGKALDAVGQKIVSQVQKQIELTTEPPNAPSTVGYVGKGKRRKTASGKRRGKGFNKPLEDSKNMKRAVSHRVIG